jgi:predicted ester cyclase
MSNKSVSARFFETYGNQHDVEGCNPLFAEDCVIHFNGTDALNIEEYKQLGYAHLVAFPDLAVTVLDQIEEGDKVVSRVRYGGTHRGELMGVPPTSRTFQSEDVTIDRMVDGQIKERWIVSDLLGMMQQLGIIPAPGA